MDDLGISSPCYVLTRIVELVSKVIEDRNPTHCSILFLQYTDRSVLIPNFIPTVIPSRSFFATVSDHICYMGKG